MVTLTGTGGSGKTRLAVEYGQHALDDYPDGVWFVDLRGSGESGVTSLIASTLGVVASGEQLLAEQLAAALSLRGLLLVLDNCEHVGDAVARLTHREPDFNSAATRIVRGIHRTVRRSNAAIWTGYDAVK